MASTAYQQYYAQYDEPIRVAMDSALTAGLGWVGTLLPALLVPVVIVCGVLLAVGQLGMGKIVSYSWRVILLIWLTVGAAFVPYVRDMVQDTIPNELASVVNGKGTTISAAAQFDKIDDGAANFTAKVMGQATGLMQVGNRIAAWANRGWGSIYLQIIFYVWIAIRQLTSVALVLFAFSLVFLPFDSTRHWCSGQLGKVVGLIAWQLAASVLLKINADGMEIFIKDIAVRGQSMSIEEQVDMIGKVSGWFLGCMVQFLLVPGAIGIGSGVATSSIVASGMMMRAATSMVHAGSAMTRAAYQMRNRK